MIYEILEFISDVLPELGSEDEVAYARRILKQGSGATRQLRVFQETNDLKQVVDYMIAETEHGLFEAQSGGAAL